MESVKPVKPLEFLTGGGEMGERIRHFDWSLTSVGDPGNWSQSLRSVLSIMMATPFPMLLWWGKDYIQFYNDTYIPVPGLKHPKALGQPGYECWPEIWHVIGPLAETPFHGGPPTWMEDILLMVNRNHFTEETHFTIAYSAVPDSTEPSGIGGVLATVIEITEAVISRRQMETLKELGKNMSMTLSEEEVYTHAVAALQNNLFDIPYASICRIEEDPSTIKVESLPKGAWDISPRHYVKMPITASNKKAPLAMLTLALNPYRQYDDSYKNFVQLIADQISLGLSNALAYEEERKRTKALEDLDKAKTTFFSNISHEFRTPLTLILGSLEEALKERDTLPRHLEKLEIAHRNAMRLLKLVNMLLDFSRIESGRHTANFALTDLGSVTRNLAGNFRSIIENAGLKYIVTADTIIQPVYVDRQMWEKIIFNLISNAFKYTLDGSITVNLYTLGNNAVLEVEDTGVGIPEKELPHMFERFHRVQNNVGRTYEGTGIGLSLIKELIHLHSGTILVNSVEGRGSIFTVTIPFGKDHLPAGQTSERSQEFEDVIPDSYIDEVVLLAGGSQVQTAEGNEKEEVGDYDQPESSILVVDDNADMRLHLQSLLQKHFRVITAANGMDALHKIIAEKPSLILTDIMMPIMDGTQLLKEVRKNPATRNLPVILLTARAGEESKVEGYETGADDYLVKPFSANELIARVRAHVKLSKIRRDMESRMNELMISS